MRSVTIAVILCMLVLAPGTSFASTCEAIILTSPPGPGLPQTPFAKTLCEQTFASRGITVECVGWTNIDGESGYQASCQEVPGSSPLKKYQVNVRNEPQSKSCPVAGNPVSVIDGLKYEIEIDYLGTGPLPLKVSRHYTSREVRDGIPGGWRFSYSDAHRIHVNHGPIDPNTGDSLRVMVIGPDLRGRVFEDDGNDNWSSDPDETMKLEEVSDGSSQTGWKLTTDNDRVEYFNYNGKITSIEHRGKTLTFSRSNNGISGKDITIEDDFGKTLVVKTDSEDRVVSFKDPALEKTEYEYYENNTDFGYTHAPIDSIRSVTYPDGTSRIYDYRNYPDPTSTRYLLTGITDERGNKYATFDYIYPTVKVDVSRHTDGVDEFGKVTLDYKTDHTIVTNSRQKDTEYHFESIEGTNRVKEIVGVELLPNAEGTLTVYDYDDNGFIDKITDAEGNITDVDYNSQGLEESRTRGFGTAEAVTVTTTWDPTFRLPKIVTYHGTPTQPGLEGVLPRFHGQFS